MSIHAWAPHALPAIGAGTDTGVAVHGLVLGWASGYFARVELLPRRRTGAAVSTEGALPHGALRFVRAAAAYFQLDGLTLHISDDLPNRAGQLSASHAVAMVGALAAHAGKTVSPMRMALIANQLYTEEVQPNAGLHSFLTAALGGIRLYDISPFPRAVPIALSLDRHVQQALERRLFLACGAWTFSSLASLVDAVDAGSLLWRMRVLPQQAADFLVAGEVPAIAPILRQQQKLQTLLWQEAETAELRKLSEHAHTHQASLLTSGELAVFYCAVAERRESLQAMVERHGYRVMPVTFEPHGVRVWRHDPAVAQPFPHFNAEAA